MDPAEYGSQQPPNECCSILKPYPALNFHLAIPSPLRLAVEDKLVLEPLAGWVTCPSSLLLHHSGRGFEVRVDPSGLPPGLHFTEVCGYDSAARWRGALFRVPITVIRPIQVVMRARRWGVHFSVTWMHMFLSSPPTCVICVLGT